MKVLNKYRDRIPKDAVSIMRPGPLGNPFRIGVGDGMTRARAIELFERYARRRIAEDRAFRSLIKSLWGHDLVCCCKPKSCHGDVLVILCEELQ